MSIGTRMRATFFAGVCIAIAGLVLRFSARMLVSTEMGPGWWSIDETAQMQLQRDARITILFGLALILLACHRWLWLPEPPVDAPEPPA